MWESVIRRDQARMEVNSGITLLILLICCVFTVIFSFTTEEGFASVYFMATMPLVIIMFIRLCILYEENAQEALSYYIDVYKDKERWRELAFDQRNTPSNEKLNKIKKTCLEVKSGNRTVEELFLTVCYIDKENK